MKSNPFTLLPGDDPDLFFSDSIQEEKCIGHLRIDFGGGYEFWPTWWPHTAQKYNDSTFRIELNELIDRLRKNLFKNRACMYKYIADHPVAPLEDGFIRTYGYCIHTERYSYFIRCMPDPGNYNAYVYCYVRED